MKGRKIISLFLVSLMIISLVSTMGVLNVSAVAWDGSVSASLTGSGSESDPYLITDGADLAYLAARVNGGDKCLSYYFKQTADIDLGGREWTPIGTTAALYFGGEYDGSGFVVKNFTVTNQTYAGLFGYINGGIQTGIKDLIISDADISGQYAGTFVAYAIGCSYVKGCVAAENCAVRGTSRAGGIASTLSTGAKLSYCISNATVTGAFGVTNGSGFGGIVGIHGGGATLKYCVNNGNIIGATGVSSATNRAGGFGGVIGLWGAASAAADIEYCYNTGDVTVGPINVLGPVYVGGLIGIISWLDLGDYGAYLINNCLNYGQVFIDPAGTNTKDAGAFTGMTRYAGYELRKVYALDGTCDSFIGEQRYDPDPISPSWGFADQTEIDKLAAYVNKYLLEYNPAFSTWLLDLDVSNIRLPKMLDAFSNVIEDLNIIATPSASFTNENSHPGYLNDGTDAYWTAEGYTGEEKPWVQYDFPCAVELDGCIIKWYADDTNTKAPTNIEIQYWNGSEFIPTVPKSGYYYNKNAGYIYRFDTIETTALRIVITPKNALGGDGKGMPAINEWNIIGSLAAGSVVPKPQFESVSDLAKPVAAYSYKSDFVFNLKDNTDARWSAFGYTDARKPWVQYKFPLQVAVNGCVIRWYDDDEGNRVPKSIDIQYWDGSEYRSVEKVGAYSYLPNQDNIYNFKSVNTNILRVVITPTGELGGDGKGMPAIDEWNVIGFILLEYTDIDLENTYLLASDKEPDTGDNTVYAVITIAVSSVSLAALLVLKRRKRQGC